AIRSAAWSVPMRRSSADGSGCTASTRNSSRASSLALPSVRGGPFELEHLDSSEPSLAFHCLHGDGHRQLHRAGAGRRRPAAAALGALPAVAAARLAALQRSLLVRPAVRYKVAWEESMTKSSASGTQSASKLISDRIAELGDWRGKTLSRMRTLIKNADPEVVEEWKWVKVTRPGTPVWSHDGIICTGESYKNVV